jgi:hypothetical protein
MSIAGSMLIAAAKKEGAYLLLFPILWMAGLMMWICFIVADRDPYSDSKKYVRIKSKQRVAIASET